MKRSIYLLAGRMEPAKDLKKSHHKGPRPFFAQFKNWRFAEEVRSRIISLTSREC